MERRFSSQDYSSRNQPVTGMGAPQEPGPLGSVWQHFWGTTEQQQKFAKAAEPYRLQYKKQKTEMNKRFWQQKRAAKRFFDNPKKKMEFKKIKRSLGIAPQKLKDDPEKNRKYVLEKLRKNKVSSLASLRRQHITQLKELRADLKKSASKPYSSVA